MKLNHKLMNNNFTSSDFKDVKKLISKKCYFNPIKTSRDVRKKVVKMARCKIFDICKFWFDIQLFID